MNAQPYLLPVPSELEAEWVERRSAVRYRLARTVPGLWLPRDLSDRPRMFLLHDISAGGFGFHYWNMIHNGAKGAIILEIGGKPEIRCFTVVNCRYISTETQHIVGCQWIPIPKEIRLTMTQEAQGLVLSAARATARVAKLA